MTPAYLLARALDFAARAHSDQRRKGKAAEPYINHVAEVALLLAEATDGADPQLVAAGILHDTIEDTGTSFEQLSEVFGQEVAALVQEVTDDKRLPKESRKLLQIERAPYKSARAKLIKIADKISNLRSLTQSPPADWPTERQLAYIEWASDVVAGCRGVNAYLDDLFDDTAKNTLAAIRFRMQDACAEHFACGQAAPSMPMNSN